MKSISIIGAGASGLMAAVTILENSPEGDYHIQVFEKNMSPGKKVLLSGGGRCNLTTGIVDKKILLSKYTRGADFIRKAFGKFSPQKCWEWFESHGVPLKCEADLRVFPISDDGSEVVEAFEKVFAKYRNKVTPHYGEGVEGIVYPGVPVIPAYAGIYGTVEQDPGTSPGGQNAMDSELLSDCKIVGSNCHSEVPVIPAYAGIYGTIEQDPGINPGGQRQIGKTPPHFPPDQVRGRLFTGEEPRQTPASVSFSSEEGIPKQYSITTKKGVYDSDFVIVTTGGNAYSHTGSTGDGYAFARALGHTVTKLGPSLSSFLTQEKWLHQCSGIVLEGARLGNLSGSLLLTHFGLSGPLAFMTSSVLAWDQIDRAHPRTIDLSPLADMGYAEWEIFLKDQFQNHPKKLLVNILSEKLPRKFAEGFIHEYFASIENTYPVSIGRGDRERMSKLLSGGIPLTLVDRRPGDEFVTAGGVDTDEIDPETMESRLQKNLYFAGEVLNVDGFTGGFSLQICWASGYVAGRDIASKL